MRRAAAVNPESHKAPDRPEQVIARLAVPHRPHIMADRHSIDHFDSRYPLPTSATMPELIPENHGRIVREAAV